MIGMDFISFLILLIISVVVSGIGSAVIGNWPHRIPVLNYADIWIVPAILGAVGVLIVVVDIGRMVRGTRQ